MKRDFEFLLDEAISRVERGETVEDCLARHPRHAEQLEPLLRMAAFNVRTLARVEPLSEAASAAGKQHLLARAAQKRLTPHPRGALGTFRLPVKALATAALAVLLLVVVGGGLVVAAADSLPGDMIYPVKLAVEQTRLLLTFDTQAQDQLRARFAQERRAEVRAILKAHRRATVRFEGTLESLDDMAWIVAGLQVTLDAHTRMEGVPMVGAAVAVEGQALGDGSLWAIRLTVKEMQKTPRSPIAPRATMTPQPTAMPRSTRRPTGTPVPSVTPHPTMTPTARHSLKKTHSPCATETCEARPTHTPCPMETRMPHPTVRHAHTPTHMLEPPCTPMPAATQTSMPTATHTPMPTATHTPMPTATHTSMPTRMPHPTEKPHMTKTPHH